MKYLKTPLLACALGALALLSACASNQPRPGGAGAQPVETATRAMQPPIYFEEKTTYDAGRGRTLTEVYKLEVESWRRLAKDRWAGDSLRAIPAGNLYLVAPAADGKSERMVPLAQAVIRISTDRADKKTVQVEGPQGTFESTIWHRVAMCSRSLADPKPSDCLLSESGVLRGTTAWRREHRFHADSGNTHPVAPVVGGNMTSTERTFAMMDPDAGRVAFEGDLKKSTDQQKAQEQREKDRKAAVAQKTADEGRKAMASARRGTTMFCETRKTHLVPGETITQQTYYCDLLGDTPNNLRELLNAGWIVKNETRTPIQGMMQLIYQVSLQLRKE